MKTLTWADAALGIWLIASPLALGLSGFRLLVAEQIPGVFLIATVAWILVRATDPLRVSWLQAMDGLWLIVGSFVLLFNRLTLAAVSVLVAGLLVFALSLMTSWRLTRQFKATA